MDDVPYFVSETWVLHKIVMESTTDCRISGRADYF